MCRFALERGARCGGAAALTRIEADLDSSPETARLQLNLRRELEAGRTVELEQARPFLAHILNQEDGI